MSQTTEPRQWERDYDQDLDEFLEEHRDILEKVADGDYAFSPYAQRLLDSIDGGAN